MKDEPIAVTVLGGYLGAGKTTLVNHLLRTATDPLAVLINDFGDITIDTDLIVDHDGTTMELANGCICCSLVDGFVDALDAVLAAPVPPVRVLIEASGVADPGTAAAYAHRPGFRLDGVVVLADVSDVVERAGDRFVGDTVVRQLDQADLVLATKADLVPPARLDEVLAWLGTRVDAPVVAIHHGRAAPDLVLGHLDPVADRSPLVPDDDGQAATHQHLPDGFAAVTVYGPTIDLERLRAQLTTLDPAVVRAKGIVTDRSGSTHAVHLAGRRVSVEPATQRTSDRESTMVFLGREDALPDAGWLDRLAAVG